MYVCMYVCVCVWQALRKETTLLKKEKETLERELEHVNDVEAQVCRVWEYTQ